MTGKRILVIEDEYLVAADIESILSAAGVRELESAATEGDALKRIEESTWDAVIADANLNGRNIAAIAAALSERHIPFVIVTGYGRESLPAEVRDVPIVSKPFRGPQLLEALNAVLDPKEARR